jgi:hypothetical protein
MSCLIALLVPGATPLRAQGPPASLAQFLTETAHLTTSELADIAAGRAVVKELPTTDGREVALIGVQRIDIPRATLALRLARVDSGSGVGVFSDPAQPSDVAGFSVPHSEVETMARCQPGSCKVKLPGDAIAAMAGFNPDAEGADTAVSAAFGRLMLQYVTAYRTRGNEALIEYGDRPTPNSAAKVWDGIVARSAYMYAVSPSLANYLRNYPHDRPPGLRETIFWTQENIQGAKPMATIMQRMVYEPTELTGTTVIVSKQLYCSHYLDGGLNVTAIVDATAESGRPAQSAYLLLIRRLHFDDLPSGGPLNIRGKVISRYRDATVNDLRDAAHG